MILVFLMLHLELTGSQHLVDQVRFGGGVLIYVREDIPYKQLTKYILSEDIEGIFFEKEN